MEYNGFEFNPQPVKKKSKILQYDFFKFIIINVSKTVVLFNISVLFSSLSVHFKDKLKLSQI